MAKAHKVRSIHELDGTLLAVLQAARRLDRRGVYPSGDRLILEVEDEQDQEVRRARRDLVAWGFLKPVTAPDSTMPEPDPHDDEPLDYGSARLARDGKGRRPRDPADPSKALNIALFRIVEGKGSVYQSLAVVLGITPNAVKCRVDDARWRYPSEDLDPEMVGLTAADKKYLAARIAQSEDPASIEFAAKIHTARRARPDRRSQARDCPESRCRQSDHSPVESIEADREMVAA